MTDLRLVLTERLELSAVDPARDVPGLFPIWTDPLNWEHAPALRHQLPDDTLAFLEQAATRWEADGLGYWTARSRERGSVVGAGGVQRHVTGAWNILYRLGVAWRSQGLAQELVRAALAAATEVDPSVPCIAWIRPNNPESMRTAEALGLVDRGLRIDPGDGVERFAYADRELGDAYGVPVAPQKNFS